MKLRILLYSIFFSLLLSSCHPHRLVVTGKDAVIVGDNDVNTEPLNFIGKADNKYTSALLKEAYSWIGTPYLYGGKTRDGADCSGFVMVVYKNSLDITLPRVSQAQGEFCNLIKKDELFPGDLLFFVTGKANRVSHVGIYVGEGKMIHASSSKGVIVTDISQKYFVEHFHHCGRIEKYFQLLIKGN